MFWLFVFGAVAQEMTDEADEMLEEERFHWQYDHQWKGLRLYRPLKAVGATWSDRLLVMDSLGQIHRLNSDGSWVVVYDGTDEGINEEDLLLDLESSLSEQWDEYDDTPQYDEDTEQFISADSVGNEWESAIDDPLLNQDRSDGIFTLWTDEKTPLVFGCSVRGCVRSTNDGGAWSEMEDLPPAMSFSSLNGVYMAGTAEGLYTSKDKGQTWEINLNVPKELYVHDFAENQQYVVAATSSGIWLTIDAKNWSQRLP